MIDKSALPIQIDKYVLNKSLGGGAFGQVFLAYDRALDKEKALKAVHLDDIGQLPEKLKEAHILDKCSHKNIVHINEANIFEHNSENYLFFDLELIKNGSVQSRIDTTWISVEESCRHMREVLSGLGHAHQCGFIHRDIKPANILLGEQATKLSDFGLATTAINLVGSGRGYRTHLAPEYFTTGTTTHLTDIYAAGITLYRFVINSKSWATDVRAIPKWFDKVQAGKLISHFGYPLFIPNRVKRIINKACHSDPSKRYQSALEMRQDLDALRFGIEWTKVSDTNWIGYMDGDTYEFEVVKRRKQVDLNYYKNKRKDNRKSKVFGTVTESIASMEESIAETAIM